MERQIRQRGETPFYCSHRRKDCDSDWLQYLWSAIDLKKTSGTAQWTLLAHSWGVMNDEPTVIRDVIPSGKISREKGCWFWTLWRGLSGGCFSAGWSEFRSMGRSRSMQALSLSCHKLGEKWRPRGRRSFVLHLNLRRVVEVVDRGTNNLNIPLSDQLAAGRKNTGRRRVRLLKTWRRRWKYGPPLSGQIYQLIRPSPGGVKSSDHLVAILPREQKSSLWRVLYG